MRAAVALRDVVGETQHRLVVAVGPLHRHFDGDAVLLRREGDRRAVQHLLRTVEIFDEGLEPALVMHNDLLGSTPRPSVSGNVTPEFRKASSRSRCSRVWKSNSVLVKVRVLGRKVISVPVLRAPLPSPGRCGASPTSASGDSGSPSRKRMKCSLPPRQTRKSSREDSAFTTETPTPCKPPATL